MSRMVLIVDDEKHIREDLARYLKRRNYLIESASTLVGAIDIVTSTENQSECFDYAIIDLKLDSPSEYGGIQIFLSVKHYHPKLTPIILSAYPFQGEVEKEFKKALQENVKDDCKYQELLKEVQDNYISKGDEKNYMLAILEKLEEFEEKRRQEMCDAKYGSYHGLLIAQKDYDNLGTLHLTIDDARNLQDTLKRRYLFENIILLEEPSREEILGQFETLIEKLTLNDNLLIFYAGHGHWDAECEHGYWLPRNAKECNRAEWISYSDVRQHIKRINAKHVLLINDACFAGGVMRNAIKSDSAISSGSAYESLSRKAMTSGAIQEVPDKSIFMKYLLQVLEANDNEYITAIKLYSDIYQKIKKDKEHLEPEYNTIRDTNDNGGHFVFVRK